MKTKYLILLLSAVLLNITPSQACKNCGCRAKSNNTTEHTHSPNSITNDIYAQKSEVIWKAAKIGGDHEVK